MLIFKNFNSCIVHYKKLSLTCEYTETDYRMLILIKIETFKEKKGKLVEKKKSYGEDR